MKFCGNCGNPLNGEKFCPKCGTKVDVNKDFAAGGAQAVRGTQTRHMPYTRVQQAAQTAKRGTSEKILFESKGWPKKKTMTLLIGGIVSVIIGCLILSTLPESTDVERIFLTDEEKSLRMLQGGLGILLILAGVYYLTLFISSKKVYIRIYNTHIKGFSGIWIKGVNVNIPIETIGELYSVPKGKFVTMPALKIITVYGTTNIFYMDSAEVNRAEQILRSVFTG